MMAHTNKKLPLVAKEHYFSAKVLAICLFVIALICLFSSCDMQPARADIVSIAQSQIGLGEVGGNNKGKEVKKYLNGQENLPWCAGFVSWCAKESGYELPYLLRAFSFTKHGEKLSIPKSGDLAIFTRNGGGHIGIIETITKDGFVCIEGNVGEYPARVKRVKHSWIDNNISMFVRLQ